MYNIYYIIIISKFDVCFLTYKDKNSINALVVFKNGIIYLNFSHYTFTDVINRLYVLRIRSFGFGVIYYCIKSVSLISG